MSNSKSNEIIKEKKPPVAFFSLIKMSHSKNKSIYFTVTWAVLTFCIILCILLAD